MHVLVNEPYTHISACEELSVPRLLSCSAIFRSCSLPCVGECLERPLGFDEGGPFVIWEENSVVDACRER